MALELDLLEILFFFGSCKSQSSQFSIARSVVITISSLTEASSIEASEWPVGRIITSLPSYEDSFEHLLYLLLLPLAMFGKLF